MIRILCIGDVASPLGAEALLKSLPQIKKEYGAYFTVVNGENSAKGNGITKQTADIIFSAGADVITGGNHTLRHKEFHSLLDENPFLLRPHNLDCNCGSGYCLFDGGKYRIAVINLSGQVYLDSLKASNPFKAVDELTKKAKADGADFTVVDLHAEATSEKRAMGFYLDGKVSVLFGTHTHVQTSDAQVLPNGTGYITDLGMTGPENSVLGVKTDIIINRLRDGNPAKFEFADGDCTVSGCVFDMDEITGLCLKAENFTKKVKIQ